MSIDKAISKINDEMQKDPNNPYLEIIGHYLIERCADESAAALILTDGKTLKGSLSAVENAARKKLIGNCANMLDKEIFNVVDAYFGFACSDTARAEIKRQVDGDGSGESGGSINRTPSSAAPASTAAKPATTPALNLNLEDFL